MAWHRRGSIIDWLGGVVGHLPAGLQHYEVAFYANSRAKEGSVVYVVSYDYDPSTEEGFIYLPGKGDEWFPLNASTIYHGEGLEGNWFRATGAWEGFVRPLIARTKATGPNHHGWQTGPPPGCASFCNPPVAEFRLTPLKWPEADHRFDSTFSGFLRHQFRTRENCCIQSDE